MAAAILENYEECRETHAGGVISENVENRHPDYRRVHVKGPRIGAKRKVSKVLLMQGSQDGPDGKTQPPGSEFPAQVVRMNA